MCTFVMDSIEGRIKYNIIIVIIIITASHIYAEASNLPKRKCTLSLEVLWL